MTFRFASSLAGAAIVLLLLPDTADSGEDIDAYLPNDTLFYASFDLKRFQEESDDLALIRFLNDSRVKSIKDQILTALSGDLDGAQGSAVLLSLMKMIDAASDRVEGATFAITGLSTATWSDVLEISNGNRLEEITFVRVVPELILSVTFNHRSDFIKLLAEFGPMLGIPDRVLTDLPSEDFKVLTVALEGEEGSSPFRPELHMAFAEDRFLLGNDKDSFEGLLEGLYGEGRESSLSRDGGFRRLKNRLHAEQSVLTCALNIPSLLSSLQRSPLESHVLWTEKLEEQGADEIAWFGLSSRIQGPVFRDSLRIVYGHRKGALRLLDGFIPGLGSVRPIPEGSVSFSLAQLDPLVFLERLKEILSSIDPGSLKSIDACLAEYKEGTGIDPEAALETLGGATILHLDFPTFGYMPDLIMTAEIRDRQRLETLLAEWEACCRDEQYPLQKTTLKQACAAYRIDPFGTDISFSPSFCILGDHLYLAANMRQLNSAVDWQQQDASSTKNLWECPAFKETLSTALPNEGTKDLVGLFYLDVKQITTHIYKRFLPLADFLLQEYSLPLDTSLLPPADIFEEHFDNLVLAVSLYSEEQENILALDLASPVGFVPLCMLLVTHMDIMGADYPGRPESEGGTAITFEDEQSTRVIITRPPDSPFLGVYLNDEQETNWEIPGILILDIVPGSPAEEVGLKKDDSIIKIGDTHIDTVEDLRKALNGRKPGDELLIRFLRDGEELSARLILGRLGDFFEK